MASSIRTAYQSLASAVAISGSKSKAVTPLQRYVKHVFGSTEQEAETRLADDADRAQRLRDIDLFITSKRTHAELLERYNPIHNLSEQERIRLTARRVGLNMPIEHDPDAPSSSS